MEKGKHRTLLISLIGGIILAAILAGGTVWMNRAARRDTTDAVRSVSLLYLDELAGRRGQVVENNLNDSIRTIRIAIGMIKDEDLSDLDHMRAYQREMKQLFNLERFAFVDTDGLVYTADEGVRHDIDEYGFDPETIAQPEISIKNIRSNAKKVIIAVPVREQSLFIDGKQLVVCFMEISMEVMLQGISLTSQNSGTTFCNLYTSTGVALSNTVLGGLAVEDNLLSALGNAEFEKGHSAEAVIRDFEEGKKGTVSFTYDGIQETLSYVPVGGTDWMLTYLIRESVISERISFVTRGILGRSILQSLLVTLVMAGMLAFLIFQDRKSTRIRLEKETSEAASRIKHQEMEERLALQEQLLAQREQQDQQAKMITALASDYRGVYYLELDRNRGTCYQSRTDMAGPAVGEQFDYLESVTAYCNTYVVPECREEFLRFITPESIREGLSENRVISFNYTIRVDGKESYEAVRFAGVRHPEDRDDHLVHNVGACFADVDAEMRRNIEHQQLLSEALNAAEQASRAKTALLSNMSHEIRTPMNAIIGLNNIALNDPTASPSIREYLRKCGVSAQHLLSIINDILDMSRIESGRMVVKQEEFSFARCLEQVNTIISGQCRDKGLHYECRTTGKIDDYYVGDEMKIKQVMINILGNAVKFTPEGGEVTFLIEEVTRYEGRSTLRMTFRDTGIGMSREFLPRLFDPFSQEDSSSTSKFGSTGLGMPITRRFVEIMNGNISVESEKGVGTTFTVTLTLGEAAHDSSGPEEGVLPPHEMNVLVIDDDQIALEHAQIVLGQAGINCEVAQTGEQGLEMVRLHHARRKDFDLLLVDWKMPEMDGVETTRRVRSLVGQDTPIIILTSYNWDEVAAEARQAGVDTFVPKPLFAGSVLDQFREAFKKKKTSAQVRRADLKGRHILLAEDVAVNAEIMVMLLGMREIDVDVAENGRIALEKFAGHPEGTYDAILMDMRMPEMDGLEATRRIRALERPDAGSIPIIALTANAFDEDVQNSLQAGLNAHLSKPVQPEALFDTLETLIQP